MAASADRTGTTDGWRRWGIDWRHVVSRSTVYALVLTAVWLADATIRADSLSAVPHPLLAFAPLLAVVVAISAVARSAGVTDRIAATVDSPMVVYLVLCLVIGALWALR